MATVGRWAAVVVVVFTHFYFIVMIRVDRDRISAIQVFGTALGKPQHAVIFNIFFEKIKNNDLSDRRNPKIVRRVEFFALAEYVQFVVFVAADVLVFLGHQQVGNVFAVETLAGELHRIKHQRHLLLHGECFGRLHAVVTEAAIFAVIFAKITEQLPTAAHAQIGVSHHLAQQVAGVVALGDRLVFIEFFQFQDVGVAIKHQAVAFQPIAPGAARFLIVAFQRLRNVVVDDEAHIGLVDAHPEGNGCHDHLHVLVQEGILVAHAGVRVQPGVVGQRPHIVDVQQGGDFLHLFAAKAINNP